MEEINLLENGKMVAQKSKALRSTGLAFAILSLFFLLGGILAGMVLPLFIQALKNSAVFIFVSFFNNLADVDLFGYIYMGVIAALFLGTVAYVIVQVVKMFSSKTLKSGNSHMLTPWLFIALEVLTLHDLCSNGASGNILPSAVYSDVGIVCFLSLLLSVVLPLVLIFIYKCVAYFAKKSLWENEGIKITKLGTLAIVSAAVTLVVFGVICYFNVSAVAAASGGFINALIAQTYGSNPLTALLWIVKSVLASPVAVSDILGIVSIAAFSWVLVEVLRTFGGLLFGCFIISADRNYLRGSKYFSHAAPIRSSFLLALSMFVYTAVMSVLLFLNNTIDIIGYIRIGVVVAAFVVSLVLSIVYESKAKNDKEELLLGVDFTDNDINGVDYNKDLVLNDNTVKNNDLSNTGASQEESVQEPASESDTVNVAESAEEMGSEQQVADDKGESALEPAPETEKSTEEAPVETGEQVSAEEPVKEEVVHETIYAKEAKLEKKPASDMHAQVGVPPYGYPYAPYPQPFMPYPYAPYPMPYPMQPYPVQPYPMQSYPQQPANNSPTIICVPYPMMGGYAPAPVQAAPVQPAPAAAPVQQAPVQPAPAPAENAEEEVTATEDVALVIPKKTLEEKYSDLKASDKKVYNTIMKYAMTKEGVKRVTGTNADVVSFGRDCIVKTQIKSGVIVCSFSLFNYEAKNLIKQEKAVKERLTTIRVVSSDAVDAAKQSIDLAYKLAVEAKEARHQEQLRKRRETKKRKAEEAKNA